MLYSKVIKIVIKLSFFFIIIIVPFVYWELTED